MKVRNLQNLALEILAFVNIIVSGPSLLIEFTNSMIISEVHTDLN